jgi:DNA-binding response OmpR family regulator
MPSGVPVILIASASSYERNRLERALEESGRRVCAVTDADEAEGVCAKNGGASILVIDSGLLEEPRDTQWRDLRNRRSELSAVVRCLVSRDEILRADRNTLLVYPSNTERICDALDLLDRCRAGEIR